MALATKGGLVKPADGSYVSANDARPDSLRRAVDASLRRLQTDYVDLYQLHRVDPQVPIEESWGAMKEIVQAENARVIGLSEVTEQLARAAHIHPVATVQSELSLWTRDALINGVVDWCKNNGSGFLAYAPLSRGFLTGTVRSAHFGVGDYRGEMPRFSQHAIDDNKKILEMIQAVAQNHAASLAQVSLGLGNRPRREYCPDTGDKETSLARGKRGGGFCWAHAGGSPHSRYHPQPTSPRY